VSNEARESAAVNAVPLTVRARGGLVVTCCAAMFCYAVYFGALGVLMPFLGAGFGLGIEVRGRLFPFNFGGYVGAVLVCGYLSDRFGRKRALLLSTATYVLGLVLFGTARDFSLALMAAVLIGGGSGAMETVAAALAADLYPERRAFVINAIQVAFGFGAVIGPSVAHHLLIGGTDWRALYLSLAFVNALLFLAMAAQPIPHAAGSVESLDLASLKAVFRRPAFGVLCLTEALYVGAETGFFLWMPTYFEAQLPGGKEWAGRVVSVFWIAMTVGRAATGALIGRLPLMRLSLLLGGGGALFAALAVCWRAPFPVMVCVALTGLCFSGIFGVVLAEAGERFPHVAGTVFGAVVAAGGVGGVVVPWAVGALTETSLGWRGALLLVPASAGSLALLSLWLERHTD
jgi:FHS family glucose/mannose:H+ symporter-like MFS transporter